MAVLNRRKRTHDSSFDQEGRQKDKRHASFAKRTKPKKCYIYLCLDPKGTRGWFKRQGVEFPSATNRDEARTLNALRDLVYARQELPGRGFYATPTVSFRELVVKSKFALRSVVYGAHTDGS